MVHNQNPHLTDEQKQVLFDKATEPPFSGAFLENKKSGEYTCANCGIALFSSDKKFDSGSGWPSFSNVISKDSVRLVQDYSHGMERVEVQCGNCGAHMGHVFNDGPKDDTGMRFCINSLSLDFLESKDKQ